MRKKESESRFWSIIEKINLACTPVLLTFVVGLLTFVVKSQIECNVERPAMKKDIEQLTTNQSRLSVIVTRLDALSHF